MRGIRSQQKRAVRPLLAEIISKQCNLFAERGSLTHFDKKIAMNARDHTPLIDFGYDAV
jgi:hypothetical protein